MEATASSPESSSVKSGEIVQKFAEFNMSPAFLKGPELDAEIDRQYEAMKKLAQDNKLVPG